MELKTKRDQAFLAPTTRMHTQLQRQTQWVLTVSTHLPIPSSTSPSQGFGHLALIPPTLPQDLCNGVQTARPKMPVWLVTFKLLQRILSPLPQRQGQELLSDLTQCSQRKSRRHVWPWSLESRRSSATLQMLNPRGHGLRGQSMPSS